ncbi:MAG: two-component system sensor histidine kinase KdpD, partial [Gammaproteobacteria bacterium]
KSGRLQICVEGNGIGVDESQWDAIATPFKRLNSDKDYPGMGMGMGMGMGLALCCRIAQVHGG